MSAAREDERAETNGGELDRSAAGRKKESPLTRQRDSAENAQRDSGENGEGPQCTCSPIALECQWVYDAFAPLLRDMEAARPFSFEEVGDG